MGSKRFRTQRLWHNTLVMVWVIPFLILPGIIVGASSGEFLLSKVLLGLAILGILLALRRDSRKSALYSIEDDRLTLTTKQDERVIMISEIRDASLLDRIGSRSYLQDHIASDHVRPASVVRKEAMLFCTVDIGLNSLTFGIARRLIDRLPSAKRDLLLLRLRDGRLLLLSPTHGQDMVDTLGRRKLKV